MIVSANDPPKLQPTYLRFAIRLFSIFGGSDDQ
jgi:hypothetical protein